MWDWTHPSYMTSGELAGCLERMQWLLDNKRFLPQELYIKLETWHLDMTTETEDRAAAETAGRRRARA